jgi:hypothetical protein
MVIPSTSFVNRIIGKKEEKNNVRRDAYQGKPERYGEIRFYGTFVYRQVRGGKKRRYRYWFVCGTIDAPQTAKQDKFLLVRPITSADERNALRVSLATVIPGVIVFEEAAHSQ